jgi:hypothetical protein
LHTKKKKKEEKLLNTLLPTLSEETYLILPTPVRMVFTKQIKDNKCWPGQEQGTLAYC